MANELVASQTSVETEALRRSLLSRLSTSEKLLLAILAVAIVAFSARPVYELWAGHRAARLREEVYRLRGSQEVKAWARLLDLTRVSVAKDFPRPLSWLLVASEGKVGAFETSVRGPARDILRESVLRDPACVLKALRCTNQEVSEWVVRHIGGDYGHRRRGYVRRYPETYQKLVGGCLSGDASVREFVLSGSAAGSKGRLRCGILLEAAWLDEARAYPLLREFLVRHLDAVSLSSATWYWVSLLGERFVESFRPEDLPLAERLARTLIQRGPLIWKGKVVRQYLRQSGRRGLGVFEEGLACTDAKTRGFVIHEAANQRLLSPHKLWRKALGELDPRCRVVAARVLGYERANESADALAKLLKDPIVEVQLQAAWSLASMGDSRGRDTLERCASAPEGRCRDLLELYAPPYSGKAIPPPPPPPPAYLLNHIARAILADVDAGGTIPLTVSSWPGTGQPLEGKPAVFFW